MRRPVSIAPPKGKLGVLTPGMGAVSTTLMAGVELVRRGESMPVGSLTQMGTIRLGKRTESRIPQIKDFVQAGRAERHRLRRMGRVPRRCLQGGRKGGRARFAGSCESAEIPQDHSSPMKAAFDQNYVKNLHGTNVKKGKTKFDLAEQIARGHSRLQEKEQARPAGDGVVRVDRSVHEAGGGAPGPRLRSKRR